MNGEIHISIVMVVIASFWMVLSFDAMAQQLDDTTRLEQMTEKLRASATSSVAAKRNPSISKKRNVVSKKKKREDAKEIVVVPQETTTWQKNIEVKQPVAMEAKPVGTVINVRAEAQALAKAAVQLQLAAQIQTTNNSQAVKIIPFNRTMRLPETYNLSPSEDGVHDPANEGINSLHAPLEAFADLPRRNTGNRVDWAAALNDKKISPRWERSDAQAEGMVMDMDIVRVPRGSMPNVVFPHKQHTEWLTCSNCHPAIFVPRKGANQISMRLILSGEKCGVCHGKVAFPPSECRLCHSQSKDLTLEVADAP